ncbi:ABC-type dipeptide/oligopeptide/nickel transport system permease component [Gaiella occulta]|uniref:ABC-type dipeptide/oligopeptide/nickel transport system permease component n=1 Tax=Gaiella occulta TaxID=1002870 RepID=A0A7M2Z1B1_9ACTN|nr:ABC transporter permease [Gaiella occulta]RDI75825.1 ABC-type dipeptide/oligopeptide/nickel transport system permease component [Gaiella occulta]
MMGFGGNVQLARVSRSRGAASVANVVRALAFHVPTAFLVVTLIFLLPRIMPGDPLLARTDPDSGLYVSDPQARERFEEYYGLNRSLGAQYVHYVGALARGELGWSIARSAPVATLIGKSLPWTLLLVGTAILVSSLLGFIGGVTAAWRRGRTTDRGLVVATTLMRALPEYVWAVLLLVLFAVVVPIFPLYGAETPFAEYGSALGQALDVIRHLVLPATALAFGLLAGKFLLVRNTVLSALGQDYMLLARAKGLPERRIKYRHAGRNALLPFLTAVGIQVGFAVGGAVLVESVFAYPGMGSLILRAVNDRDYPLLEGAFLVLALTVIAANAVVDLAYARLDPRAAAR